MTCVPESSKLVYDKAVNMTFGKLHFKIRNSFYFIINWKSVSEISAVSDVVAWKRKSIGVQCRTSASEGLIFLHASHHLHTCEIALWGRESQLKQLEFVLPFARNV